MRELLGISFGTKNFARFLLRFKFFVVVFQKCKVKQKVVYIFEEILLMSRYGKVTIKTQTMLRSTFMDCYAAKSIDFYRSFLTLSQGTWYWN